mmetsp:Transcript_16744/g.39771  ORF Transcript_16744/g.39771 Transcript_16744/m.39771 type:complete len:473 (+) Transcript_16744:53-1471(+)
MDLGYLESIGLPVGGLQTDRDHARGDRGLAVEEDDLNPHRLLQVFMNLWNYLGLNEETQETKGKATAKAGGDKSKSPTEEERIRPYMKPVKGRYGDVKDSELKMRALCYFLEPDATAKDVKQDLVGGILEELEKDGRRKAERKLKGQQEKKKKKEPKPVDEEMQNMVQAKLYKEVEEAVQRAEASLEDVRRLLWGLGRIAWLPQWASDRDVQQAALSQVQSDKDSNAVGREHEKKTGDWLGKHADTLDGLPGEGPLRFIPDVNRGKQSKNEEPEGEEADKARGEQNQKGQIDGLILRGNTLAAIIEAKAGVSSIHDDVKKVDRLIAFLYGKKNDKTRAKLQPTGDRPELEVDLPFADGKPSVVVLYFLGPVPAGVQSLESLLRPSVVAAVKGVMVSRMLPARQQQPECRLELVERPPGSKSRWVVQAVFKAEEVARAQEDVKRFFDHILERRKSGRLRFYVCASDGFVSFPP